MKETKFIEEILSEEEGSWPIKDPKTKPWEIHNTLCGVYILTKPLCQKVNVLSGIKQVGIESLPSTWLVA